MSSFIRKRHVMYQLNGVTRIMYQSCDSISLAKKLSRELQSKGHTVEVDRTDDPKPAPKRDKGDAADRFIAKKRREMQAAKVAEEQARRKGPNTITLSKSQLYGDRKSVV